MRIQKDPDRDRKMGEVVLRIFLGQSLAAGDGILFPPLREKFARTGLRVSDLSDGIYFLLRAGYLRRGSAEHDAYYLTDAGAAIVEAKAMLPVADTAPASSMGAEGCQDDLAN